MDQILNQADAQAKGYISIADAIKGGLTEQNRTTLYRKAKSGAIPSCEVKRGSKLDLYILASALGQKNISATTQHSYQRLKSHFVAKMRNGTFDGDLFSEDTIASREWALNKFWTLLGETPAIQGINAENFEIVLGLFKHNEAKRQDFYASKMQVYKALTGFTRFLIQEGLKTDDDLSAIRKKRPKQHYKPKKKLVEDWEIDDAITFNARWRGGKPGSKKFPNVSLVKNEAVLYSNWYAFWFRSTKRSS